MGALPTAQGGAPAGGTTGQALVKTSGSDYAYAWGDVASSLIFADSLVNTAGTVTLVNDTATPGNSKYYGTNSSGTLGYFALPAAGGVTSFNTRTGAVTSQSGDYTTAIVADSTNKRYVTDAQLVVLGNTSGTNTGDQTSIVGITGTKAQFDTAVTDGNFLYVGDVSQYTDEQAQDSVGAMVDGSLNYVDATPLLQRSALTGDVTASAGSNSTTIANDAVTFAKFQNVSTNVILGRATAASGDMEELLALPFALSGDITTSADSNTTTLATVNSNVGSFTNANITVNGKGLVTAAANGSSGGTPGGSDTQIQFNDSSSFGGDSDFTWNKTSNVLTDLGTIDLGNADTSLARSAAGVMSVEGVVVPTISSTNTITNKRNTKRSLSTSGPGGTPTLNTDTYDVAHFTAVAAAITSMTTNLSGTPVQGDQLRIDFTDDGTARAITWGATFEAGAAALPTTTVVSTRLDTVFYWNTVTSKWRCMANSGSTVGAPGGSDTQVQYNNAGAFGGITGATTNGTALTLVAPVLGTPASGVMTNVTGTAAGLTAGNVTTNANLTGDVTSSGNATTLANIPAIAGTNLTGTAASLTAGSATKLANVGTPLSTADTTVANQQTPTTGGVTLASQTLAAGSMWWIHAFGDYINANSATARNLEVQPNWGGTNLTKATILVKTSVAIATTSWTCDFYIVGTSTTAAWVSGNVWGTVPQAFGGSNNTATSASNTSLPSGAQTLDFRVDTSASVVGDSIVVKGVLMMRVK